MMMMFAKKRNLIILELKMEDGTGAQERIEEELCKDESESETEIENVDLSHLSCLYL